MKLDSYFADMHIHVGRDREGRPVKITGSKTLTLTNILKEASNNKGMHLIGVIDCHIPSVQGEILELIQKGHAKELDDGGIRFENVTLLLGTEIEIYDETCHGPIHVLAYFPTLSEIANFTNWLKDKMSNINLSSQRYYGSAKALQHEVKERSGLFIPAHIFTPFKSLYGKGVKKSLTEVFNPSLIDAVELGLSSDTNMAKGIEELNRYTFLSNSDAHSLGKIGREYQEIRMAEPNFKEFTLAIHEKKERKVTRNFGMDPRLGKYYYTVCKNCMHQVTKDNPCEKCGSSKTINGVKERIDELTTNQGRRSRPPYIHQVPLEYIPALGPKTYLKLLSAFETEMNIIHHVKREELEKKVPKKLAQAIIDNRNGKLKVNPGGGGKYGKVLPNE